MSQESEDSEDIDIRRKRLRFRSWHRGTKELDLLLGGFADRELGAMGAPELELYEALLEVPEPALYAWLSRQDSPPPEYDHEVMRRLMAFAYAPGRA